MKQHITPKQLAELSEKGKKRLWKRWKFEIGDWMSTWWVNLTFVKSGKDASGVRGEYLYDHSVAMTQNDHKKYLPLLSIGQMVEFLQTHKTDKRFKLGYPTYIDFFQGEQEDYYEEWWSIKPATLCNDLWEAVKKILKNN